MGCKKGKGEQRAVGVVSLNLSVLCSVCVLFESSFDIGMVPFFRVQDFHLVNVYLLVLFVKIFALLVFFPIKLYIFAARL